MKQHLISIGIVIILVSVGFSGCVTSDQGKFIGTWNGTSGGTPAHNVTIVFFSNGSGYGYTSPSTIKNWMTWTAIDGNLTIKATTSTDYFHYSFSNDDRTLTLEGTAGKAITTLHKIT